MAAITIRREIGFPGFGLWKWRNQDFERPLKLQISQARAFIYTHEDKYAKGDLIVFPRGHVELLYNPAPQGLLDGLRARGSASAEAARIIYDAYIEAYGKFEALLLSAGRVHNLLGTGRLSIHQFFTDRFTVFGNGVEWRLDQGEYQTFIPKLPKPGGRNPLYSSRQLVTPIRWQGLQKVADEGEIPDGELLELFVIRSKAAWRELRIAAVEASIISETLLRRYGVAILKKNGFSNAKIKRLKDELSFNNLLNVVLPLSLSKGELHRVLPAIEAVDRLRGIRNDLVHGNLGEKDVERGVVEEGIEGAIRLAGFLGTRLTARSRQEVCKWPQAATFQLAGFGTRWPSTNVSPA